MSAKSDKKLKKKMKRLDRPFEPTVRRHATEIAARYRIVIEAEDSVGYLGRVMEMPMVMADGVTPAACFNAVREAAVGAVAVMLEAGETPPGAAVDQKRTAQINVRVTEDERMKLEDAARRQGFRGVSDFVRTTALTKAG